MSTWSSRSKQALFALVLGCAAPSCFLLPVDPAPTLDAPESPALLARASGSIVVADGAPRLRVVSLPSGRIDDFPTLHDTSVASGLDECGHVVLVRMTQPWIFADAYFTLVLKSLATGEERVLCQIGRDDEFSYYHFVVDLAAGRAMCSFKGRKPRIFDIETGRELEIAVANWGRRHSPVRLSSDGNSVICSVLPTTAFETEPLISIDLETGLTTSIANGWPFGFDPEGGVIGTTVGYRDGGWVDGQRELPGCTRLPCTFVADSLAIYEGLASPASHPESHFGLAYPTFERSIRIADTTTRQTATLVPRFGMGSFAYSRFDLPANSKH